MRSFLFTNQLLLQPRTNILTTCRPFLTALIATSLIITHRTDRLRLPAQWRHSRSVSHHLNILGMYLRCSAHLSGQAYQQWYGGPWRTPSEAYRYLRTVRCRQKRGGPCWASNHVSRQKLVGVSLAHRLPPLAVSACLANCINLIDKPIRTAPSAVPAWTIPHSGCAISTYISTMRNLTVRKTVPLPSLRKQCFSSTGRPTKAPAAVSHRYPYICRIMQKVYHLLQKFLQPGLYPESDDSGLLSTYAGVALADSIIPPLLCCTFIRKLKQDHDHDDRGRININILERTCRACLLKNEPPLL